MNTLDAGRLDGQVAATDSALEPRDTGSAREVGRGPVGVALPGWLRVATASPRVWAALMGGLFLVWNLVNLHGAMITGVPLWLLGQNVQAHPYQGSYLNEVVRAILPPQELADHFDFHSWGTPLHHGVRWLNAFAPVGTTVYVPDQGHLLRHYRLRPDLFVADAPPVDLVMYPSWWRDLSAVLGGEPRFAVQCYGADMSIYTACCWLVGWSRWRGGPGGAGSGGFARWPGWAG